MPRSDRHLDFVAVSSWILLIVHLQLFTHQFKCLLPWTDQFYLFCVVVSCLKHVRNLVNVYNSISSPSLFWLAICGSTPSAGWTACVCELKFLDVMQVHTTFSFLFEYMCYEWAECLIVDLKWHTLHVKIFIQ